MRTNPIKWPQQGTPNRDFNTIFRYCSRCSSIFIDFQLKWWFYIWQLRRDRGWRLQNILQCHVGLKIKRKSQMLDLKSWKLSSKGQVKCSTFPTPQKLQFSSITPCFHPKFPNPYCRKGSYGPYGPFWLSVKMWTWSVKSIENQLFWEKNNFPSHQENEFILWR